MAASMMKITKGELINLLHDLEYDEEVGYLFTAREDYESPDHQVLVFFEPIHSL